jgi:hypothetical protein
MATVKTLTEVRAMSKRQLVEGPIVDKGSRAIYYRVILERMAVERCSSFFDWVGRAWDEEQPKPTRVAHSPPQTYRGWLAHQPGSAERVRNRVVLCTDAEDAKRLGVLGEHLAIKRWLPNNSGVVLGKGGGRKFLRKDDEHGNPTGRAELTLTGKRFVPFPKGLADNVSICWVGSELVAVFGYELREVEDTLFTGLTG